jgi:hypothetical protein
MSSAAIADPKIVHTMNFLRVPHSISLLYIQMQKPP